MTEPRKRYIAKEGIVVDAEVAERLGVEGGVESGHRIDPGEVARRAFNISAEQAKCIREEHPSP